jgi:hypothetical protein
MNLCGIETPNVQDPGVVDYGAIKNIYMKTLLIV